ncbi:MAG: phosphate regulon sensor histidine kinase PhoR [Gammaproteobacteria bacterium]
MLSDRIWRRHLLTLSAASLVALAIGYRVGYPAEAVLAILLAYLVRVEMNLYQLSAWLKKGKNRSNHNSKNSIWHELYELVLRLERRNRKRKQRFNRLLSGFRDSMSALPDATVVLSESSKIEWCNSVATGLLGIDKSESVSRRIDELIQDPEFISYLKAKDYTEPLEVTSPVNGEILLLIRIVPYSKGKRLLQARDITMMHRLTNVRREFVANASHELRTPLTVVHGYLESMLDDPALSTGPWHRAIAQMYQQSNRVKGIVEDMLTLSQLEQGRQGDRSEPVDIASMLTMLREEAEMLSGKDRHKIRLELDSDCKLVGSSERIQSIFANLVSNAVRYTPAGGNITIRWKADADGACFSVTDTGIGIEARHISRLTERFYRVDVARSRERGGTGLGLAIVKHILNLMGGQLTIASQPGTGSTFSCIFPSTLISTGPGATYIADVIQASHKSNLSVIQDKRSCNKTGI